MRDVLDAAAIRAWCEAALDGLGRARVEIDDINVYPVPDGDTGTNLYLTMEAAAAAVRTVAEDDVEAVLRALADGAFIGARGNSGVITSQLLRGLAGELVASRPADGLALASGLRVAADLGYGAVGEPVEGTILTVARAAAEAARAGVDGSLGQVATVAAEGAEVALARTPEQLSILRQAGVVDAGGRGLCVILDALAEVVTGLSRVVRTPLTGSRRRPAAVAASRPAGHANRDRDRPAGTLESVTDSPLADGYAPPETPQYEVMYLLDAADAAIPKLKSRLIPLGNSLVVVGGGGRWNVHVHVDDPGPAVEAGVAAGRPYRIQITDLYAPNHRRGPEAGGGLAVSTGGPHGARRAVVALTSAPGLTPIFGAAGAAVVGHEPNQPPAAGSVVEAIHETDAGEVVLVSDGGDAVPVAEAAAAQARDEGVRVAVIPARSCVQAIAAIAVHEPDHPFDTDVIAMSGAAGAARHAEVTITDRDAVTSAGLCRTGDVLGLIDGDVALISSDVTGASVQLLDRMLDAGGELVTLVTGASAPPGLGQDLVAWLRARRPEVECVVYDGGQDVYPLLVGVE